MNLFGNHIQSLVSSDRLCNLIKYSQSVAHLPGYMLELGVYSGGSLEVLAKYNPGKDIIAIDSFQGLPPVTDGVDFHREGEFSGVDHLAIAGYFKTLYNTVRIVKGFIPEAFNFFDEHVRFCFSHIDLDLYKSVKDALDFVFPRTLEGGIILLDDYKVRSTPGCEKAVNEFFNARTDIKIEYRGELKFWEGGKSHNQYLIVR